MENTSKIQINKKISFLFLGRNIEILFINDSTIYILVDFVKCLPVQRPNFAKLCTWVLSILLIEKIRFM